MEARASWIFVCGLISAFFLFSVYCFDLVLIMILNLFGSVSNYNVDDVYYTSHI